MPVSRGQFQVSASNIWKHEENADLSWVEGLDDHIEDTYPKWDVEF